MKFMLRFSVVMGFLLLLSNTLMAENQEFTRYERGFKNFLTCELTRTDAPDYFQGKPFKISMIQLFDIHREGDVVILTGAIQCFVADRYQTLFPALGVNSVLDREKVSYYTLRPKDFSILATELFQFPYKERCPWVQYWVDTD